MRWAGKSKPVVPKKADETRASHSLAFETFVQSGEDEDDVIGLLGYALYKQSIREDALAGVTVPADRRAPSETTVQAYRGAASQLVTGVINRAIEEATPAIQESAVRDAIIAAEANVKAHVDSKTSWKTALGTNLAAWLISLAIVFLVLVLARAPEVTDLLVKAVTPSKTIQPQQQQQQLPPNQNQTDGPVTQNAG